MVHAGDALSALLLNVLLVQPLPVGLGFPMRIVGLHPDTVGFHSRLEGLAALLLLHSEVPKAVNSHGRIVI